MSKLKCVEGLFSGRHFGREVILLCVRWYLRYKLSLRDLVEMMAERELQLAHTTVMRWVQRYVPEFEKSWACYARKVGRSWRVDETYLKVRGRWVYLYRAVGQDRQYRGFPSWSEAECSGGQGVLLQGLSHARARPLPSASLWTAMRHRTGQCVNCQAKTRHGGTLNCERQHT
jgi:hypothetical protein